MFGQSKYNKVLQDRLDFSSSDHYNKWHRKIPILGVDKSMLKFKEDKKSLISVVLVLDQSSSMTSVQRDALSCLNYQLETYKKESKRTGVDTQVSIHTFNDYVKLFLDTKNIDDVKPIDESSPVEGGMTALYDGIGTGLNHANASRATSKIVIVITDGEENRSRLYSQSYTKSMIRASKESSDTTLVICCPPNHKDSIVNTLGVDPGNVTEWEATTQGIKTLNTSLQYSTQSYYNDVKTSGGIMRSASFFSPDLNLDKKEVKRNLTDVTDKFFILSVKNKQSISSFISDNGYSFRIGNAYYELTKTEEVQDYKTLILQDKRTGKLYTGDEIRDMVKIPDDGSIKLGPSWSPDYRVFVRSTSWNRNLVPNTTLLYKVK